MEDAKKHSVPRQHTLGRPFRIEGIGLHTGARARLAVLPAPEDAGICFVRRDLPGSPAIPATADYIVDTTLATTIGADGVTVGTVEHLLAALYASGVDNARAELFGPEVPILDGSARPFVQAIREAGLTAQGRARRVLLLRRTVDLGGRGSRARLSPARRFSISCRIDFGHPLIRDQRFEWEFSAESFARDIAPARTFGFVKDADDLHRRGLALGASVENVIAVNEYHVINKEGLRFPDEFVRHKVLDAVGDIAFFGCPIVAELRLERSGHTFNHRLVRRVLDDACAYTVVAPPDDEQVDTLALGATILAGAQPT